MTTLLTRSDSERLADSSAAVEEQIKKIRAGASFRALVKPCTLGDGIRPLDAHRTEQHTLKHLCYEALAAGRVSKFVPASGAATRMFQGLDGTSSGDESAANLFFERLPDFAFYPDLENQLRRRGMTLEVLRAQNRRGDILEALLSGLGYGNAPKGLVYFHRDTEGSYTAFEEHLHEALLYAHGPDGVAQVHFTVPASRHQAIRDFLDARCQSLQNSHKRIECSVSVQDPSSDTIVIDADFQPLSRDGHIMWRPAGHGALLSNLASTCGDIVLIKNIDNVVPQTTLVATNEHRKYMIGLLVALQRQVFDYLVRIRQGDANGAVLTSISEFLRSEFYIDTEHHASRPREEWRRELLYFLNRPLRVCGVVKKADASGGGPFFTSTRFPLQIIESAEVNMQESTQRSIWSASTHFNPVDVVCGLRDCDGRLFDLPRFRNDDAYFLTEKSIDGSPYQVLELPGLWNGSMARWLTVFVEVPSESFNPVKTVTDLLNDAHQN